MPKAQEYHVPRHLLKKYAKPGPRYTSYPTVPVWKADFGAGQARQLYAANNPPEQTSPLAFYFHLPFCTSLCWYCGCHVKISRNRAVTLPYLKALEKELELVCQAINPQRQISQMHWGGGTPTYLTPEQIQMLVATVRRHFDFTSDAEISIEVDPRVTSLEHLQALRDCRFNRISMGVQDFNPQVQRAVNRIQSYEDTAALVAHCRQLGFISINIDLMYGLPFQTVDSFAETLKLVHTLAPDRLALFHYAHVPWLKPAQKLIKEETLPNSETKLDIFEYAIDSFLQQGYHYIGMDHFAKPEDELALAQANHTLRRNFMGYTTQAGTDLYGFGVSSISEIDGHFLQNQKLVPDYQACLQAGKLPVQRGMWLSADDKLRKAVIEQLICNCYLDFKQIETEFHIDFASYFQAELRACEALAEDELLRIDHAGIHVLPRGQILIRNICMVWDAYLSEQQGKQVFSRTA